MTVNGYLAKQNILTILLLLLLLGCGENRHNMQSSKLTVNQFDAEVDEDKDDAEVDEGKDDGKSKLPEPETVPVAKPGPEAEPEAQPKPATGPALKKGEVKNDLNLGIGYEDYTDNDFNDSVICFVGSFAVDLEARSIRSLEDQMIEIFVKRNSGITQNITIGIVRDGNILAEGINESSLGRQEEKRFQLAFKANDRLKVDFSAGSSQSNKADLTSEKRVVIEMDNCRTSGI